MPTRYLLLIGLVLTPLLACPQTLPAPAQALLNQAQAADPARYQYALSHGAQILPTTDSLSFYLLWRPAGAPPNGPLIVTLHGSSSWATDEFFLWHAAAQAHGVGILALQWWFGSSAAPPQDYYAPQQLYREIDRALQPVAQPRRSVLLHGFSRGAANSYGVAFLDQQTTRAYFCLCLANAGSAQLTYPLYRDMDAGNFGPAPLTGTHWALFCGGRDPAPTMSGCIGMQNTAAWVTRMGATVELFIQDSLAGHGGFHQTPAYVDSVLTAFDHCRITALGTGAVPTALPVLTAYPNPFGDNLVVELPPSPVVRVLRLYDARARLCRMLEVKCGQTRVALPAAGLPPGLYQLTCPGHTQPLRVMRE